MFMKNKFYSILLFFFIAALRAGAQDTTVCNAQFYVSYDGNTVYFRAIDSIAGVQHQWSFGDSTQSGWGNYVGISHTYSHPGTYTVIQRISNPATGCHDSAAQSITIAAPPPNCSITFYYSHDSTRAGQPYYFYAQPYVAGATSDSVTWRINDTLAGFGDTLSRVLQRGTYTVCATLVTSSGCRSQYCQTINVGDTATPPPPGDTTGTTTPPDSTVTPPSDSTAQMIRSYPNPAYSFTNVILKLDNPQMIYIRVYNSMGGQVETRTVSGYKGENIVTVPLGSLQAGIYYIELQYGNVIKRSRIQKL